MEAAAGDAYGLMVSRLELLGYNMLRPEEVARRLAEDPNAEYYRVKVRANEALVRGRDNFAAGRLEDANSNFAFAYQMRCTADWVWVNVLGRKGNSDHALYLRLSRNFSKLACGGAAMTAAQKREARELIACIQVWSQLAAQRAQAQQAAPVPKKARVAAAAAPAVRKAARPKAAGAASSPAAGARSPTAPARRSARIQALMAKAQAQGK